MKCEDCKTAEATEEGFLRWCEECFEKGLAKEMEEHWKNFFKKGFEEIENGGNK